MPSTENPTPNEAAAALQTAERARFAAATPRPASWWLGPVQGGLFAAATILFFGFGGADSYAGGLWGNLAGAVAVGALVALNVREVRRTGVSLWPVPGGPRSRVLLQLLPFATYAVGWLAAIAGGRTAGAVASGVAGGLTLCLMAIWHNASLAKARAGGQG